MALCAFLLGACSILADFPDYDGTDLCGDDIATGSEQCDGEDLRDQTCTPGDRNPAGITCTPLCQIDRTGCGGRCGDGIQQPTWEDCDGGDYGGATCTSYAPSATGGSLACTTDCQVDLTGCVVCGDGVMDPGEACDGTHLAGQTCESLQAGIGGSLACGADCQFDLSGCGTCGDGHCQTARGESTSTCPGDCAYTEIAASTAATCALRGPGVVWCWGNGEAVGPSLEEWVPVRLPGNLTFTRLVAGSAHFCALTPGGGVYCWGAGSMGQLGNGANEAWTTPTPVDLSSLVAVSLGAGAVHTCAVIDDGRVYCWGANHSGCLGSGEGGTLVQSNLPLEVVSVADATAVAAGAMHTCALRVTGEVACWGSGNAGQLGDGAGVERLVPVLASGIDDALEVSAANLYTCALRANGAAACWGNNDFGELGDGTTTTQLAPSPVPGIPTGLSRLVSGLRHTCAVGQDGHAYCWGDGAAGKLGRLESMPLCADAFASQTIDLVYELTASPLGDVVRITAGTDHSCALDTSGRAWCWGLFSGGILGLGPPTGGCMSGALLVEGQ